MKKPRTRQRPEFRTVKTVGALVRHLSTLPKTMSLAEAMKVVVYNEGPRPDGWVQETWKPVVDFEKA